MALKQKDKEIQALQKENQALVNKMAAMSKDNQEKDLQIELLKKEARFRG